MKKNGFKNIQGGRCCTIDGRRFRLPPPFPLDRVAALRGQDDTLRLVLAAFLDSRTPLNVLLSGPAQIGKTLLGVHAALALRRPLYVLQGHSGLYPDDVTVHPVIDHRPTQRIEYVLSGACAAMKVGGVLLIDELLKIPIRTLNALIPALDWRRCLQSNLAGGFTLHAHPQFRVIACSNGTDLPAALPDWLAERFPVRLEVGNPGKEACEQILRDRFGPGDDTGIAAFLQHFWRHYESADRLPSPRKLIDICTLSLSLARQKDSPLTGPLVQEAIRAIP